MRSEPTELTPLSPAKIRKIIVLGIGLKEVGVKYV
jgi:hypothetical protein